MICKHNRGDAGRFTSTCHRFHGRWRPADDTCGTGGTIAVYVKAARRRRRVITPGRTTNQSRMRGYRRYLPDESDCWLSWPACSRSEQIWQHLLVTGSAVAPDDAV